MVNIVKSKISAVLNCNQ